jgi:hypothetical protein
MILQDMNINVLSAGFAVFMKLCEADDVFTAEFNGDGDKLLFEHQLGPKDKIIIQQFQLPYIACEAPNPVYVILASMCMILACHVFGNTSKHYQETKLENVALNIRSCS